MSDQSGGDTKFLPSSSAKKRANPSSGWIVMVLAGLLAAVIFFYASVQGQKTYFVMALSNPVVTGEAIDANNLRRVEVNMPGAALNRLIQAEQAAAFDGWIATGPMEAGDLLNKSVLRPPAGPNGLRAMSIPREQRHVVAGAVRIGDRVDVITETIPAQIIAADLEILAVNGGESGGLGSANNAFSITVAVTPKQATEIAEVLGDPKFDVVRSTGAIPLPFYDIFVESGVLESPPTAEDLAAATTPAQTPATTTAPSPATTAASR